MKTQKGSNRMRRIGLAIGIGISAGALTIVGINAAGADGTVHGTTPSNVRPPGAPPLPPTPSWWGPGGNRAGLETNHPAALPVAGPDGQLLRNPDGSLVMRAWPSPPAPPTPNAG